MAKTRSNAMAESDREHVMRPHGEAQERDRQSRGGDEIVAVNRLAREHRDNLGDDSEGGQDHDVDLRMAEGPEDVLPQHRRTAGVGTKEMRVEQPVGKEHNQTRIEYRHHHDYEEAGYQGHPDEQRHTRDAHSGSAHRDDGRHQVDPGGERAHADPEQAEYPVVHARAVGIGGLAEWRVREPSHCGRAAIDSAGGEAEIEHQAAENLHPEAERIEPRKGHVARANHQRHHVRREPDQQRHHHQEDHRGAMHRKELVEDLRAKEVVIWHSELHAH